MITALTYPLFVPNNRINNCVVNFNIMITIDYSFGKGVQHKKNLTFSWSHLFSDEFAKLLSGGSLCETKSLKVRVVCDVMMKVDW